MHYTSGTTGRPKGVTTGLWDEDTARAVFEDEAAVWQFDRDDLHLVCSPMYHTVSIRFSAGTLLSGGSLAILSRFDAAGALAALRRHRPTTAFLVPTHLQRILNCRRSGPTSGSTRFASSSMPARPAPSRSSAPPWPGPARGGVGVLRIDRGAVHGVLARRMARTPGNRGPGPPRSPPFHRSAGRRRRGVAGEAEGGAGTIWSTMPDFARFAYWRNEAATAQAWRGDACTIGDLGTLDAEGYLYLTGRRHDLIISGGVNVYPAEVENVLAAVAGVAEVAVFGLPDAQWGQRVCAAYVAGGPGPRRPCGRPRLRPRPLQAAQDVRRRPGPAPHSDRQAHPPRRARAPGAGAEPS